MRFRKLNWLAILLGFAADVAAMETSRYGLWYGVRIWAATHDENFDHLVRMVYSQIEMAVNVAGAVFLVMGGFLTGYLARNARYANAGVVGVAKVAYNCLTYSTIRATTAQVLVALCAPVPFVLVGAFFAGFLPKKESPLPPPVPIGERGRKLQ